MYKVFGLQKTPKATKKLLKSYKLQLGHIMHIQCGVPHQSVQAVLQKKIVRVVLQITFGVNTGYRLYFGALPGIQ